MNSPQYSSITESHSIDLNEGSVVTPQWIQHQQLQSPVPVQQSHYIPQLTHSISTIQDAQPHHPAQMSIPMQSQTQTPLMTTSYLSPQAVPQSNSESPYDQKNRSPRHRSRKSSSGSPRRSRRHSRSNHRHSFGDETDNENHKRRNRSRGRHERNSRSRGHHHRRKSQRDDDSEDSNENEESHCMDYAEIILLGVHILGCLFHHNITKGD